MITILNGTAVLGFILPRGRLGFEAFDRDERSLGIFPTQAAAAEAVAGAVSA